MEKLFFVKQGSEPLYIRLYMSIVEDIQNGVLLSDEKMPSIRQLSKGMNISRTTVESTYSQLVAEGYLYAKPQKGYYVMQLDIQSELSDNSNDSLHEYDMNRKIGDDHAKGKLKVYDFVSEYVEPVNFDMSIWKKNINKAISAEEFELFSFSNPFGEYILKEEIAKYFTRVRGISANSCQIIIGAGAQSLLRSLSIYLKDIGFNDLCIDNPGFNLAKDVFKGNGYYLHPIDLKDNVLDVSLLPNKSAQVLFTSPSYQFPYGEIMTMRTRYELLNWASKTGSYIIEDDYNNELRYIGKPIPSLQGMDTNDRVVYLGSFSTLLIPSIRISFMVLPMPLLNDYQEMFKNRVQSASKLEQLALGHMLSSGDFAKHIRKLRKAYKAKHKKLESLCDKYLSGLATYEIPPAGVSAIITLSKAAKPKDIKDVSEQLGLNISLLSDFKLDNNPKTLEKNLVLNYRGINEYDMDEAISKIKELLCRLY